MSKKKQSLVEKALSLGFTMADPNDPIYKGGVVIISTVGVEIERLEKLDKIAKSKPTKGGQNG
ncbi:hypothetical protein [Polynucleobacter sp. IMCC 29146]|uniref:hypothetical protein n=1 Tax=Polynucleobacter sp. IMCC 29146 TaxID=2780953 RepID=UPI001F172B5C|nr:hypothetical protein [Polynucleobacter sp. IMCC 29146]MCE7530414.1 hypothetical protein [Polynucleobacter sp. IMCC 29146]